MMLNAKQDHSMYAQHSEVLVGQAGDVHERARSAVTATTRTT